VVSRSLKAGLFEQFGAALIVKEVPMPKVQDDQVLVKVGACGVCYTDVKIWKGVGLLNAPLPHVLGHEIAGTVTEVGRNVAGLKRGDRVLVYVYETCGRCRYCQLGRDNECINRVGYIGSNRWGGYEEFVPIRYDNVIKIPDNLSFEDAAPLADAGLTPYHAIVDRAKVKLNETALLVGMGGLALTALQILKLAGARVVAVSRTQSKLDMAKRLGADLTVNTTSDEGIEQVKSFTDGYGVDHVFDFVGSAETVVRDAKYIRRGGNVLLLGYQPGEQMIPVQTVRGFINMGGSNAGTRKDLRDLVHLASEGKLKSIVTRTFSLEEVNEALNLLAHGEVDGRLALKM
jgi:propanol-preferring alcohol dehydrogenase